MRFSKRWVRKALHARLQQEHEGSCWYLSRGATLAWRDVSVRDLGSCFGSMDATSAPLRALQGLYVNQFLES